MKQITILLAFLIAGITNSYSQVAPGVDYKTMEENLQKSNKNLENPKKAGDPKFWIDRAKTFQEIGDAYQLLNYGTGEAQVKLFYKDPKEVQKSGDTVKYIYDRFIAYFIGGKLLGYRETQPIVANPLNEALNAYNKAIELDKENKNSKKITEGLKSLRVSFRNSAINCYRLKDFACASEGFKEMVEISEMKQINQVDTAIIYNTGYTAFQAGNYDDAIKYMSRADELNYKDDPFLYQGLKIAYFAKGDTAAGLRAIRKGIQIFPGEITLQIELINYYINKGNTSEAITELASAKEKDPKNKTFYYAEANLYDRMANAADKELGMLNDEKAQEIKQLDDQMKAEFKKGGAKVANYKPLEQKYNKLKDAVSRKYAAKEDSLKAVFASNHDKAIEQYKKAIEIDPNYFDAYYNLGVIYFNNALKLAEQAGKEMDQNAYETKSKAAEEEFRKAVPYMESAYEVNEKTPVTADNANEISKNRRQTLDVLKNLYYRLKMDDQFARIKKLQESAQ